MNPHLLYAQVIPGNDNDMGHFPGIIFGRIYINLLAGLNLVQNTRAYTAAFDQGIKKWFSEYAHWLRTSDFGIRESKMTNNHSIAYDQQLLAIALLLNDEVSAKEIIDSFHARRIFVQVEPDGKMPRELARTLALGYSAYNVKHMLEMCEMGRAFNPSLYDMKSDDGRCIDAAVAFLSQFPGKTPEDFTPYKQIADWDKQIDEICWILKWANQYNPSKGYDAIFKRYGAHLEGHMNHLLY
jgi:hypothetical protein